MAAPFSTSPPPQQESEVPAPSISSTAECRVENASISQHSPPCTPLSPATCPSPVSHHKSFESILLMSITERGASPSGFQEPPHDLSPSPHTMHDSSDQSLLSFPDATTLKDTLSAALPHASPPNACAQVSRAPRDHPEPTSIPPLEHASASSATVHAWQRRLHAWGSSGAPHSDQPDSDQPMRDLDALTLEADAAAAEAETGGLLRAENATPRQLEVGPIEDTVQCHVAEHAFPSAVAPPEPPALPWGYQSASTPDGMMSARNGDLTHGDLQRQQQLQQQQICPSRSPDSMACMRTAAPAASCMRASYTAACSTHPQSELENMKEATRSGRSAAGVAATACLDGLSHKTGHASAASCPSEPLRHIAAASDSKVQLNPSATSCTSQPQPPVAAPISHSESLHNHSGAKCPLQPLAHVAVAVTPDSKMQQNPSATRSSPPQPLPQQTQTPAPTCQWQSEPAAACGAAAHAPPEAGLTHSERRTHSQGTRPQARSGILKKGCGGGGVSAGRHRGGVRHSSHSRRVRFARLEGDDGHFDIEQHRREMSAAYALFSMARAV